RAGHPELEVTYTWDDSAHLAHVTVKQKQEASAPPALGGEFATPIFRLPVVIDFEAGGTQHSFRVVCDSKEQAFHLALPGRPQMVRFDPGNWILKTLEFKPPRDVLFHQLQHDEQVMGRIFAAQTLAHDGDAEVVAALRRALLEDAFWGVQAEVAAALGKIR